MPPSHPVAVAADVADDPAEAITLEAFNDRRRGIVIFEVTPGAKGDDPNRRSLLLDLAAGLGKDISSRDRHDHRTTGHLLAAWLHAEPVSDVVVTRAHLAHGDQWRHLSEIAGLAGAHLTLVVHGRSTLSRSQQEFVRDTGARREPLTTLLKRLARVQRPLPPGSGAAVPAFPAVPTEGHWLTFLDRCEEQLDPAQRATVELLFAETLEQATNWAATADINGSSVAALLRRLVPQNTSLDQTVTVFAAVASALWAAEWHLQYDLERLRAGVEGTRLATLDTRTCLALQEELPTHAAAAAVLTLLAPDATPSTLAHIRICDIAADGSWARIDDSRLVVPPLAQPPLRAQRHYRTNQSTTTLEPYIVRRLKDGQLVRHTGHSWRTLINGIARRRGLILTPSPAGFGPSGSWSSKAGVKVVPLTEAIDRLLASAA